MAKKLTVEEQQKHIRLSKALGKLTYGPIRSNASGISSGIVRLRKDSLTTKDIDSVLVNYGCAGPKAHQALVDGGILVPEHGKGKQGRYVLTLPEKKAAQGDGGGVAAKATQKHDAKDAAKTAQNHAAGGKAKVGSHESPAAKTVPAAKASQDEHAASGNAHAGSVLASEPKAPAAPEGAVAPRRKPGDHGGKAAAPEGKKSRPKHMSPAARLDGDDATEGTVPECAPAAKAAAATPALQVEARAEAPRHAIKPKHRKPQEGPAVHKPEVPAVPAPAPEAPVAPVPESAAEPRVKASPLALAKRLFARRKREDAPEARAGEGQATAAASKSEVSSAKEKAAKPGAKPSPKAKSEAKQPVKAKDKAMQPVHKNELAKKDGAAVVAEPVAGEPKRLTKPGPRSLSDVSRESRHTPEATEVRRQILDLDPRLWLNGWLLSFPDAYVLYGDKLRALSSAIEGRMQLGDGRLTCRELSYEVFGDEKFLEIAGDGRKLLERMGLRDIANVCPQTKLNLLHHIPHRRAHMRLVISENLDPWAAIRALMYEEDRRLILGERVDGVIFGSGYVIEDEHKLAELLQSLSCDDIELLYWGDIDRVGLEIYDHLRGAIQGKFVLKPFVAAYAAMARKARERFANPLENEQTTQENVAFDGLDEFVAELPEDVRDYVRLVIASKRLIPQEILTRYDL